MGRHRKSYGGHGGGAGGINIMGALLAVVVIAVVLFVGGLLLPVFIPLGKTGITSLKDSVSTANVNTSIDTAITLMDYGTMLWALGAGIALIVVALAIVFMAVMYLRRGN